ncbi:MAG: Rod shape-determining protein MreD [Paracidovorax wautersii]|uniref:Rod shape-determining protein MreD n=1 Tax=Paracidovorax wautersii TaxID=1177982 RepID=A0A7V8FP69_9BURK|nr:MAG: Rod shape-determining protein MreD [Paracidovorax wautersii]
MYSPQSKQALLLPVKAWFIWLTLALALLVSLLPVGRTPWLPDLMAVVLMFWCVHQPARVGMSVAFVFGLVIDVHKGAMLGQHALAYALLAFFAVTLGRRILWYGPVQQALHVLPLFAAAHALLLLTGLVVSGIFPGWEVAWAPAIEALLWPLITGLLLAPQRRAPDQDENRPL